MLARHQKVHERQREAREAYEAAHADDASNADDATVYSSGASSASMTPTTPMFASMPDTSSSANGKSHPSFGFAHVDAFSSPAPAYRTHSEPPPLLWQLPPVWAAPNGQIMEPPRLWLPSLPDHLSQLVDRQFSAYETFQ